MDGGKADRLDHQIIRELRGDGRRPTKEIAGKLGVTEATVTTRIRALNETGVMRVIAQHNVAQLRDRLPCFIFVWVRERSIDDVAQDLAAFDQIATVFICVGSPEIHLTAFVADPHMLAALQQRLGQVEGVDRLEVNLALETRTYRSDFAGFLVAPTTSPVMSDPLDENIMRLLQEDGRESFREIARVLDLPASTVRERINRLLSTKAIRIGAVCDPIKLGLTTTALGHLQVAADSLADALAHLEKLDDLGIVSSVSGRYNIHVMFGARDFAHMVSVVKSKLEITPGLNEISMRMVSETKKHRADLINIVGEEA